MSLLQARHPGKPCHAPENPRENGAWARGALRKPLPAALGTIQASADRKAEES